MTGPVVKHQPADFVVRENLVVRLTDRDAATQHYLLLRKCGYTTMAAVRLVADRLGLSSTDITYAGLKDEDGITEQLVAVPLGALPAEFRDAGWTVAADGERWLSLHHYGHGVDPLRIGRLEGNGFRVVVRNLADDTATWLSGTRKLTTFFLNYYDTQRFGVPDGPKRTHHVGAAVLAGRWAEALAELAGLGAPESAGAREWTGDPRDYFTALDPRTASFYLAAHSSAHWNDALAERVARACGDEHTEVTVHGIGYRYATSPAAATRVLAAATTLPYTKYEFVDGTPVPAESARTTVVQTAISVGPVEEDHAHAGKSRVELRFFLPSGCYATAAIRQLLSYR